MKYNVQQVSSQYSSHVSPLLDLSSEVEKELNSFYYWSIDQLDDLSKTMREDYLPNIEIEDLMYFEELESDCKEWYLNEGKEIFEKFELSLTPFFVKNKQLEELQDGISRLKKRWEVLYSSVENIEEFEDIFNWLLELPYLLEKRLRVFGLITDYRQKVNSTFWTMIQHQLKTTISETSPKKACLSSIFLKGCAV
jgi:hypothetical protein